MDKPYSPACDRNKEPIMEVLQNYIDRSEPKKIFEIGSGTGQHAAFLAENFLNLSWQTSDVKENHEGIKAWIKEIPNALSPISYKVGEDSLPSREYDYYFTANTLHIMSWPIAKKALEEIASHMKEGAYFFIYGPFNYNGQFSSDSNKAFDQSLKQKDPSMGIRDFEEVDTILKSKNLNLIKDHPMPANNQLLVFQKT